MSMVIKFEWSLRPLSFLVSRRHQGLVCGWQKKKHYVHIVHTMKWICQNTIGTSAKTTDKHEKMQTIPRKMRRSTSIPPAVVKSISFDISLVLSVSFYDRFFWNFLVSAIDAEHESIFFGAGPFHAAGGWARNKNRAAYNCSVSQIPVTRDAAFLRLGFTPPLPPRSLFHQISARRAVCLLPYT